MSAARGPAWLIAFLAAVLFTAAPAFAQQVRDIEVLSRQFPSGLRIVVARTPPIAGREPRAYVTTYVSHGSLQEGRLGRSHLIEHVVANSPPASELPPAPPEMEVFASNALTKPNVLSFVRTVSPDGLEAIIHNRLARIGRVAPTAAIFEKEKGRVLEELGKSISLSPDFVTWKALEAHANGKPASLAAELESIRGESQRDLLAEAEAAFVPGQSVLVVAGDVDARAALAMAERAASRLRLTQATAVSSRDPGRGLRTDRRPLTIAQNPERVYITAAGFHQPDPASSDYPAFLVLDQLIMGGGDVDGGAAHVARSDQSPLALRLRRSLGASRLWDGREQAWGIAPWAEGDPAMWAILFRTASAVSPAAVGDGLRDALRDIRLTAMSDGDIVAARDKLASFYDAWMFEPTYRILGDHLAAFAIGGRDPAHVPKIPGLIRAVSPDAVRRIMDRGILTQAPLVVSTVPAPRP